MGDAAAGAAVSPINPQPGYEHAQLPPSEAPQFADRNPEKLKYWLLNKLDDESRQAQEMLRRDSSTIATPAQVSVIGKYDATDVYERMRVLLETTRRDHADEWATKGWSPHFRGRLEQLVTELIGTPSCHLGVRMGTVVQIRGAASTPVGRKYAHMLVVVSRMFVCEHTGQVMAHCVMLPEDEQGSAIMTMVANQSSDGGAESESVFPSQQL